jgi:hypothetical protein
MAGRRACAFTMEPGIRHGWCCLATRVGDLHADGLV